MTWDLAIGDLATASDIHLDKRDKQKLAQAGVLLRILVDKQELAQAGVLPGFFLDQSHLHGLEKQCQRTKISADWSTVATDEFLDVLYTCYLIRYMFLNHDIHLLVVPFHQNFSLATIPESKKKNTKNTSCNVDKTHHSSLPS